MAVVGGAGAILGCINLLARRSDEKDDDDAGGQGIAPPRIPPPKELYYGESYDEANRGTLYYEPCTSSPPRALPHVDEDGIPMDDQEGPEGGRRGFFDPSENTAGGIIYVSPGKQMSALNFPLSPMDRRSYPLPTGILQGGVSPPPQMAQRSSSSHSGGIAVEVNARGFAPAVGAGHDASGASTHNVDPISLSRNFAANNTSSHPWQQGPPPPGGMLRRPMHYDANVSMRTPRRGNDAEGWSPQN
ncbi:Hypothetical protein, putative [Bodo saltans]|uniref:Uncharacterized protein n=1 Tax=Bodo saltans TaxID=75058 RepID=A0A0S4J5T2_BODSA|nr:Hypothetical protein, putative [Bodo saltans]|eukprot:CUG86770.1 Hypothetical protein, putative [Bodo saltans]